MPVSVTCSTSKHTRLAQNRMIKVDVKLSIIKSNRSIHVKVWQNMQNDVYLYYYYYWL